MNICKKTSESSHGLLAKGARFSVVVCLSVFAMTASRAGTVKKVCEPFPLGAATLGDGPFAEAFATNRVYLLGLLNPDRLLAEFRAVAGLRQKAVRYGGWEAQGINGHSLGHYLSAVSQLYAVTKDPVAKARVDYIVDELAECQRANKNGYVMTIPPGKVWDKVRNGTFSAGDFAVCGWWVPLYTLHKVFAGLRDAYRHAGNARALDVERRLADWYLGVVGGLDDAKLQSLLRSEWGGLNETFAQLYEDTGDSRYLDAAWRKFHQHEALDPLMRGTDNLDGKHANVYIPKIVGLSLLYSITGRPEFRTAVDTFWESMTRKRAFVTGGHGEHEYLYDVSCTAQMLTDQNNEACGIYNLHRIAERTFTWHPTAATMDYVERSLVNQLLAHIGRKPGEYCYFLSQRLADTKKFSKPYDSWWCCVGTGMENPQLYAALSYYHGADSLWVNLYHATTLRWPEKGFTLAASTRFPDEDTVRYRISAEKPVEIELRFRHPWWCADPTLEIGGKAVQTKTDASGYFAVRRVWKDGDGIELRLPMRLRSEPLPHSGGAYAAFMLGPQVMAGVALSKTEAARERDRVIVADDANAASPPDDLRLMPFWKVYRERYTIYYPVSSRAKYAELVKARAEKAAREAADRARTVDSVRPAFQQDEVNHSCTGEATSIGTAYNRKYRCAEARAKKGWFSYRLACDPEKPCELVCTWCGYDGGRTFDILVDETRVASVRLKMRKETMVDEVYALPAELTRGKRFVTVRFQGNAETERWVGGLFGLKLMRSR
ncbi:MAG: glycoside hydrolase family 127 protein [Kiritimatiellae bacterium]|nr:glycoside hydrolase family 127 protein [Kiritimatiellia bacterium]